MDRPTVALAGRGNVGLDEFEVAVLNRSAWAPREQPLAVFHGHPPVTYGAILYHEGDRKPGENECKTTETV